MELQIGDKLAFTDMNLTKAQLKALEEIELTYPTAIQETAFPVIMSGRDVIGISQTGTGKTFAYLLPILRLLKYADQREPRVLIIVPTRELVLQITQAVKDLIKYMHIRVLGVYGGTNINTQKEFVYAGCDILVGTPGRIYDLYCSGILRLKGVQKLVIDEVDELLAQGFRPQVKQILDLLTTRHQNLMFSATLSQDVENLLNEYFNNPAKIEIHPAGTPIELIQQQAFITPNFRTKVNLLAYLLDELKIEYKKVLVFTKSKKIADRVFDELKKKIGNEIGVIHSNKSQNFRINAIHHFEDSSIRILIATDLIARGLDFHEVSHVINFDLPDSKGDYIHRAGRTGRIDKPGVCQLLIGPNDKARFETINNEIGLPIDMLALPSKVEVSAVITEDDELVKAFDISYLPSAKNQIVKGAFHEKSDKNKKENWGGPKKRLLKKEQANNKKPPKLRF